MRIALALIVLLAVAACVRLGLWQLERLGERRAANAAARERLALPPAPFDAAAPGGAAPGRRVRARGTIDESRHILLYGREHDGEPGVHVVTPLVLAGDSLAVLVDRGWLPAADAATARPQDFPEPGERDVVGLADTLPRGGRSAVRVVQDGPPLLLRMRQPDLGSLAPLVPYALAPVWIRELRARGVPDLPARQSPRPAPEAMHLGYAIQWFAIAVIILVGSLALARSRRRG